MTRSNLPRWTRRDALKALAASAASSRLALAASPGDARFVLIVLRGALDGLALAPPYGEPTYGPARGSLAFSSPTSSDGVLKLDGLFGLHPSMPNTHALFRKGEAMVLHAVASPYRARSHFDGQDVLESGAATNLAARDGWLNRALNLSASAPSAMALAHTAPLVVRGGHSVTTWAPSRLPDASDDTLRRLGNLYSADPFFADQFEEAMTAEAIAARAGDTPSRERGGAFRNTMAKAAAFLSAPDGPGIAVADVDGWDTHANQGLVTGTLANRLRQLDAGLGVLRDGLAAHWTNTVVAVVTEFGRTVRPNGTRGTDHGTGGAALVLGGGVAGGRVIADWPGLRDRALYQGRDLAPTLDLRALFKSILVAHLGFDAAGVEARVFPDSGAARIEPSWFV